MLKIYIILGSTRQNRRSEMVGKWVFTQAKQRKDMEVELIDLRDYPLPYYDEPSTPTVLKGTYSSEIAKKWVEKVGEADGYLFVTPEYNHGYPAVLKNALDYPYSEWNQKPAAFVSYGGMSGGIRSVEQLRQVVAELQMVSIQATLAFQYVRLAFDESGNPKDEDASEDIQEVFDQLIWWGEALKKTRKQHSSR